MTVQQSYIWQQISMEINLKEGLSKQAKQQIIQMLLSWINMSRVEITQKYMKHTQFYKMCIKKYGSLSQQINEGRKAQQNYLAHITRILSKIKQNICQFLFGFSPSKNSIQEKVDIQINKMEAIQNFQAYIDKFILEKITQNLIQAVRLFDHTYIDKIKNFLTGQKCFQSSKNEGLWEQYLPKIFNLYSLNQILQDIQTIHQTISFFRKQTSKAVLQLRSNSIAKSLIKQQLKR